LLSKKQLQERSFQNTSTSQSKNERVPSDLSIDVPSMRPLYLRSRCLHRQQLSLRSHSRLPQREFRLRQVHMPSQKPPQTNSKQTISKSSTNPSYGSLSFRDLGASRAVKITVIVALCIFGIAETVFYVRAAWQYFVPVKSEDDYQH
jgi:hypothetical protein